MTNRHIAERQGVTVDAVKFHVANILAKLGFSRRAELRRWNGVRQDSNLAAAKQSEGEELFLGPIGQIKRNVTEIAASRRWYEEVLGLPHLYSFNGLSFFQCGGTRLLLFQDEARPNSIIYFSVSDIRQACAVLQRRGVEFINAPHLIHRHGDGTEEWMAFFEDNEGEPLALMSQVPASGTVPINKERN
jgi:catechol 2,3-dioxygenase-like lactoylglutathione lyase family enzyme